MNRFQKQVTVGSLILITGLVSAQQVSAFWPFDNFTNNSNSATQTTETTQTRSTLLQRIAEKFGLNQDDVDQVVADYQTERRQEMQSAYEDRLTAAVENGQITAEQKQLILEKHNQLQQEYDSENQQRQQHQEELQAWADENGIDVSYLGVGGGRGMRGGMMGDDMGMVRGRNW